MARGESHIYGNDLDLLKEKADAMVRAVQAIPGGPPADHALRSCGPEAEYGGVIDGGCVFVLPAMYRWFAERRLDIEL